MKYIGIETPCSENFHSMLPNSQGSYCMLCEKNVIDFSIKSDREIIEILQLNDKQCGRFSIEQLERINKDLDTYSFKSEKSFRSALAFSLFVVFGLTLFSCNDAKKQKKIEAFQKELKQTYLEDTVKPQITDESTQLFKTIREVPMVYEMEEVITRELLPDTTALEEVKVVKERREFQYYALGGPMSVTSLNIVTDAVKIEYDRNGMIIPNEFSSMAFPNPAQDNTTLEIKVPVKDKFQIDLYDMNGKLQHEIYSGKIDRGTFQQQVEMSDLPPGMYLITIISKEYKTTVRVSKI